MAIGEDRTREKGGITVNAPWRDIDGIRGAAPETQIHIIPSARALCNRLKRIDVTIDSGDGYRGTDTRRLVTVN
jgi:hypothetical protein